MAMDPAYRLLLVGPLESVHLRRLVSHLKMTEPSASVSVLCWRSSRRLPDEIRAVIDNVFVAERPSGFLSRIPILRSAVARARYRRAFRAASSSTKYDVVNIHYPSPRDLHILPLIKKSGAKCVLSPWGSDVLRVTDRLPLRKLRRLYGSADYVTGIKGHFIDTVSGKLGFDPEKVIQAGFGSDSLDYIFFRGGSVTRGQAKEALGLSGTYTVTCGYNGSSGQRHQDIISAVSKVRKDLPENLVLLFPFTYGAKPGYRGELEESLGAAGLKGVFFTDYLPLDRLLLLRKCSDMFIHVQPTDASSSSVKEYLLCGAKVLHGGWIVYEDLESSSGRPYFTVPSMDALPDVIVSAFNAEAPVIPEDVLGRVKSEGWESRIAEWDRMYKKLAGE